MENSCVYKHARTLLITWGYMKMTLILLAAVPLYVVLILVAFFPHKYDIIFIWSIFISYPIAFGFAIALMLAAVLENVVILKVCLYYLIIEMIVVILLIPWIIKVVFVEHKNISSWLNVVILNSLVMVQGVFSIICIYSEVRKLSDRNGVADEECGHTNFSKCKETKWIHVAVVGLLCNEKRFLKIQEQYYTINSKMSPCKCKCQVPITRKCCFCVPIRRGVTIFGYVNLVLSLLSFPLLVFLLVEQVVTETAVERTNHMDPMVHIPLTIAFVVIDIVMTIILLIGAHKKNKRLLKIYFNFGVVFQLLTLCMDLVYFDYREYIENTVYFIFLGLNIYLLFLVYNTIHLIEESSEVQYFAYQNRHISI
ncbi:hypothetical protein K1T71_008446 [Dendrolimus kikuchii]|uniref:Uncharacterized protein n=1 Tax=Dendrolimus kikuchii TaxID=765133 RepID=A0ACC1CYR8_9NEOP|nr:hypothetical protein K1T71_008446 [Dendrolimus kikuchii]